MANPENASGFFVQKDGATVAGPFVTKQEAWAEEERLKKDDNSTAAFVEREEALQDASPQLARALRDHASGGRNAYHESLKADTERMKSARKRAPSAEAKADRAREIARLKEDLKDEKIRYASFCKRAVLDTAAEAKALKDNLETTLATAKKTLRVRLDEIEAQIKNRRGRG